MLKALVKKSIEYSISKVPPHGHREELGDGQYREIYARVDGHIESRVRKGSLGVCLTQVLLKLEPNQNGNRELVGVSYMRDIDLEGDRFRTIDFEDTVPNLGVMQMVQVAIECHRAVLNLQENTVPQRAVHGQR